MSFVRRWLYRAAELAVMWVVVMCAATLLIVLPVYLASLVLGDWVWPASFAALLLGIAAWLARMDGDE